jgi:hypothetical protein
MISLRPRVKSSGTQSSDFSKGIKWTPLFPLNFASAVYRKTAVRVDFAVARIKPGIDR